MFLRMEYFEFKTHHLHLVDTKFITYVGSWYKEHGYNSHIFMEGKHQRKLIGNVTLVNYSGQI